MKLIDESETDIDDENQVVINNVHDYHSVFKPNRTCKYSYFIQKSFLYKQRINNVVNYYLAFKPSRICEYVYLF